MGEYLDFFGMLSAYLGGFNLLPLPALDGGRLVFLAYEAVTRRRANTQIEARIHMVGFVMLLALLVVVTFFDVRR
jgi:regulator of sigma E protease